MLHFISQSAPDIPCKLQKLEKGPQSPQSALTDLDFKVFNNWDKWEEKRERDWQWSQEQKQSSQMIASVVRDTFQDKTYPRPPN